MDCRLNSWHCWTVFCWPLVVDSPDVLTLVAHTHTHTHPSVRTQPASRTIGKPKAERIHCEWVSKLLSKICLLHHGKEASTFHTILLTELPSAQWRQSVASHHVAPFSDFIAHHPKYAVNWSNFKPIAASLIDLFSLSTHIFQLFECPS